MREVHGSAAITAISTIISGFLWTEKHWQNTCRSRADKSGYKMGTLTFPWHTAHSLQTHSTWQVSVRLCWNCGRHNCASCPSVRKIFLRTFSQCVCETRQNKSTHPHLWIRPQRSLSLVGNVMRHFSEEIKKSLLWNCRTWLPFNSFVKSVIWVNKRDFDT